MGLPTAPKPITQGRGSPLWRGERGNALEQRGEALAPAPAQTQAQKLLAAVGAADGADDQQPGAQRHQPRRLILSNLAFEVGDEVEQETDQAEGGFGAIEGMETKAVGAKVLLEFLDAVFALGAAVKTTRRYAYASHDRDRTRRGWTMAG